MAREIRLPQLGETMDSGTIVNCLIKVGDEVRRGDCVFEIETDKATLEMESPADGFVKHILVEVDQTLPVGTPLLVLGGKDEKVPQGFLDSLKTAAEAPPAVTTTVEKAIEPKLQPAETAAKSAASPRAKKLAKELGVNLADVTGTGPGGKITEQDVRNVASAKPLTPAEVKLGGTIPLTKKQKLTAERMVKSKREIPCFYLTVKADVTDLVELRTKLNETGSVKISYNDFIMKAVATGLEKFPIMAGQLIGDSIKLVNAIHIGLAIAVPDGLVAPVVKDVNKKDVTQIARDSQALVERARSNKLFPMDLEGGCITVSNLGSFGIEFFIPIVVPGQCSILGVGQITDTCMPDNGTVAVRKLMNMTLSVDHKITNGTYAAQFLDFVRKLLEDTTTFE
jgi:pyruvate dehydrogenase E2 component (dihydrolipoamide acetyltransferase)